MLRPPAPLRMSLNLVLSSTKVQSWTLSSHKNNINWLRTRRTLPCSRSRSLKAFWVSYWSVRLLNLKKLYILIFNCFRADQRSTRHHRQEAYRHFGAFSPKQKEAPGGGWGLCFVEKEDPRGHRHCQRRCGRLFNLIFNHHNPMGYCFVPCCHTNYFR